MHLRPSTLEVALKCYASRDLNFTPPAIELLCTETNSWGARPRYHAYLWGTGGSATYSFLMVIFTFYMVPALRKMGPALQVEWKKF